MILQHGVTPAFGGEERVATHNINVDVSFLFLTSNKYYELPYLDFVPCKCKVFNSFTHKKNNEE